MDHGKHGESSHVCVSEEFLQMRFGVHLSKHVWRHSVPRKHGGCCTHPLFLGRLGNIQNSGAPLSGVLKPLEKESAKLATAGLKKPRLIFDRNRSISHHAMDLMDHGARWHSEDGCFAERLLGESECLSAISPRKNSNKWGGQKPAR